MLPLMLKSRLNKMKKRLNIEKNKKLRELKDKEKEENFKRRRPRLPDLLKRRHVSLEKMKDRPERLKDKLRKLLKPPELLPILRDKSKLPWPRERKPMLKSKLQRKREEPMPSPRRRPPKWLLKRKEKIDKKRLKSKRELPRRRPKN